MQASTKINTNTKSDTVKFFDSIEEPTTIEKSTINEITNRTKVLNSNSLTNDSASYFFNPYMVQTRGIDGIFEADDRNHVANTSIFLYKAIVYLFFKDAVGDKFMVMETLISKDTILVVKHIIYNRKKEYRINFMFYSGKKDVNMSIFNANATKALIDKQFIDTKSDQHNWAIIKLGKPIGDKADWLSCQWVYANLSDGIKVAMTGYSNTKPNRNMRRFANELYCLFDVELGQNRLAIYITDNYCITDIHPLAFTSYNSATLYNKTFI